MTEVWRDIEGFDGLYQISDNGRVWSMPRKYSPNGKVRKPYADKDGYLCVGLAKGGKIFTCKIHRLVALAFLENDAEKPDVNHIDGDKNNNGAGNLEWCTKKENNDHAEKMGLVLRGAAHPQAKLSAADVANILALVDRGVKKTVIAKRYAVTPGQIGHICAGRCWTKKDFV